MIVVAVQAVAAEAVESRPVVGRVAGVGLGRAAAAADRTWADEMGAEQNQNHRQAEVLLLVAACMAAAAVEAGSAAWCQLLVDRLQQPPLTPCSHDCLAGRDTPDADHAAVCYDELDMVMVLAIVDFANCCGVAAWLCGL